VVSPNKKKEKSKVDNSEQADQLDVDLPYRCELNKLLQIHVAIIGLPIYYHQQGWKYQPWNQPYG
jgi:hypothetical protein